MTMTPAHPVQEDAPVAEADQGMTIERTEVRDPVDEPALFPAQETIKMVHDHIFPLKDEVKI